MHIAKVPIIKRREMATTALLLGFGSRPVKQCPDHGGVCGPALRQSQTVDLRPLTAEAQTRMVNKTGTQPLRYPRPMSFSDRQYFIQCLAEARNLSVACAEGERYDTDLRKRCEKLGLAIDELMGELVGDSAYLSIRDYPSRA